jgi:type I restriction enzyme, S subunit
VAGGMSPTYFHDTANRDGQVITISASGASAGYVNFWIDPIFASDCSTVEAIRKDVHINFVYHFLRSKQEYINAKLRSGAAQPHVYAKDIAKLDFPHPPLPEQRRIAAILDQAETLRTQRRTVLALLDTLTQSIFLDMFGDPEKNPKGWPESMTLGEVADIASGVTKGRKLGDKVTRVVPYLAVANVQDKALNLSAVKSIDATEDEIKRYKLQKNDLLLTEGGDPDKLGRGTLWHEELPECIHQNHIFRVRLTSKLLSPVFLNWIVGSQRGKKFFLRSAKQTTGIASINMTQLRSFPLLVPPLPLQQTFATRIAAIEALKSTHRTALAQLDALFASLQHRAFSGELTRPGAAALQALPTQQRSFTDLLQLDPEKGLEALIYVCKRTSGSDFYKSHKTLYFADRHHLGHHGRLIYGETYNALPMGPVPQAAYDATKLLNGEAMFSPFDDALLRAALRRTDKQLIALRDADFSKLSEAELASLDYAIRYCADMSFAQVKAASHDSAYDKTPKNAPMAMQDLIASLPQKAQQRFFGGHT